MVGNDSLFKQPGDDISDLKMWAQSLSGFSEIKCLIDEKGLNTMLPTALASGQNVFVFQAIQAIRRICFIQRCFGKRSTYITI